MTWAELSASLCEPFAPEAVSFRAGSVSRDKKRAQALAYAEPRVYEDRLNEVLGPDWGCRFSIWGEQRLICELSVVVDQPDGSRREVVRTSTGEFDSSDKIAQGTSAEAQAFKRACSKFGLGRYLYDLPVSWVGYDETTRRLTETPSLPRRNAVSSDQPSEPMLSAKRADAMIREMEKLGVKNPLQFAQRLLKTNRSFAQLTEAEALEVWNSARRTKGVKAA